MYGWVSRDREENGWQRPQPPDLFLLLTLDGDPINFMNSFSYFQSQFDCLWLAVIFFGMLCLIIKRLLDLQMGKKKNAVSLGKSTLVPDCLWV